jgi:molybdate transport system substrate-binding protein
MEITVLCAGAVKRGMKLFASLVKVEMGHDLKIDFDTAPKIADRIASGEIYDILICPPSIIDRDDVSKKFIEEHRVFLGRVGVGMAVRTDVTSPDIATPDALRNTVLGAESIVYNEASTGRYIDNLFEQMGIFHQLQRKTTYYPNSAGVLTHIRRGRGLEIGFAAITEIRSYESKGVKLVGALPHGIQNWTDYEAVLMAEGRSKEFARQIIEKIGTSQSKELFMVAGIE